MFSKLHLNFLRWFLRTGTTFWCYFQMHTFIWFQSFESNCPSSLAAGRAVLEGRSPGLTLPRRNLAARLPAAWPWVSHLALCLRDYGGWERALLLVSGDIMPCSCSRPRCAEGCWGRATPWRRRAPPAYGRGLGVPLAAWPRCSSPVHPLPSLPRRQPHAVGWGALSEQVSAQ